MLSWPALSSGSSFSSPKHHWDYICTPPYPPLGRTGNQTRACHVVPTLEHSILAEHASMAEPKRLIYDWKMLNTFYAYLFLVARVACFLIPLHYSYLAFLGLYTCFLKLLYMCYVGIEISHLSCFEFIRALFPGIY